MIGEILALIGWIFLATLALIGVGVLWFFWRIWRGVNNIAQAHNPFEDCPGGFHLLLPQQQKVGKPDEWRALSQYKLTYLCRLVLREDIGDQELQLFLSQDQRVLAVRAESDEGDVWWLTHTLDESGRLDTWINSHSDYHAAWAAGTHKVHWPGNLLLTLLNAAFSGSEQAKAFPDKPAKLRKLYARALLNARFELYMSPPRRSQLGKLIAGPQEEDEDLSEEAVDHAFEQAAAQRFPELCVTQYIYCAPNGAGTWHRSRDRLLVLHERMTSAALLQRDGEEYLHLSAPLKEALVQDRETGNPLMERFEQINERLPERHRYRNLGLLKMPLPAMILAAPEYSDNQ